METIQVENDISLMYVQADSFPNGIMPAFNKLRSLLPASSGRTYYGISRPEQGEIVYKAAAEEQSAGEASQLGCNSLTLAKGKYAAILITDFMQNISAIGEAFKILTAHPGIDANGYCVEKYLSNSDVLCMVRLKY